MPPLPGQKGGLSPLSGPGIAGRRRILQARSEKPGGPHGSAGFFYTGKSFAGRARPTGRTGPRRKTAGHPIMVSGTSIGNGRPFALTSRMTRLEASTVSPATSFTQRGSEYAPS